MLVRAALLMGLLSVVLPQPVTAAEPKPDKAVIDFFEQKIRPVLVKHCYSCHSAEVKSVKGGLYVDTRDGLRLGGNSGPAIVPGKPVESLLLKAMRYDELEMPPSGKLADEVLADFEKWIRMGAPDPRDGKVQPRKTVDLDEGRKFWSFRPLQPTTVPDVRDSHWPNSDIDRFILAALEAKQLRPAADADRRTLIRRVTFDLIGLPPTPSEVEAFVRDPADDRTALEKVVDRLLASPQFGERWGRHWLDLARYADSNGKDENLAFHEAWRYRDYVIRSLNTDKPIHRFIAEQLAGDLMPSSSTEERDEMLTATGLLVIGPKVLADRDKLKRKMDVIDEQIDTLGKMFLGLSLGCARCHDHKFDPIPTADYYALAGIFFSTRTLDGFKRGNPIVSGWMVRPLGGAEGQARWNAQQEYQKKLTELTNQIKKVKAELASQQDKATMRSPAKLIGLVVDDKQATFVGTWKDSQYARPYVGDGYRHDDKSDKGRKSATFTPKIPRAGEYEVFVSYTASSSRAKNVPVTVRYAGGEKTILIDQTKPPTLDGLFVSVGKFRFAEGSQGSVTISNAGTENYVIVDAVRFVPAGALEMDKEMAMGVPAEVRNKIAEASERLKQLEAQEKALKDNVPPAAQLVMAVRDEDKIENVRINLRGNPHQLGAEVPRGMLSVTQPGPRPTVTSAQSGRLELAQWLTRDTHPLTGRVFVNRVWLHLMGQGIVRTPDDFGRQGEPPTHPELLDHLTRQFFADGWSLKRLIRHIVLSRTYRLSSMADATLLQADPENKLFGRAMRRRLDAEALRDAMLQVAGALDRKVGGSAVESLGESAIDNNSNGGIKTDNNYRRSVYLPIIRNDLPPFLEVFDFADPEVTTGQRDTTTVPTQALFLMNNPFVIDLAQRTAARLIQHSADEGQRIHELCRLTLNRAPTALEHDAIVRHLSAIRQSRKDQAELAAWASVSQAVFGCTEFRFLE